MAKKTLLDRYNELPKEIKVLPYVVAAAALTAVVDQLKLLKLNDTITMAVINLVIIFLVELKGRIETLRK